MTITVNPDVAERIRQKIEAGRYRTADEVIAEALALLDEHEQIEALRAKLQHAADQLDRGEGEEWTPELMEQIDREADDMYRRGESPDPDVCP